MAFPIAIPLAVLAGAAVANFALQMKNYWYQKMSKDGVGT